MGHGLAPLSPQLALQTLGPLFLRPIGRLLNSLGHLLIHLSCTHPSHTRKRTHMPPTHTSTPLPTHRDSDDESETGMDNPPSNESYSDAGPTPRRPRVIGEYRRGGRGRGRGRARRRGGPVHPLLPHHHQVEHMAVDEDKVEEVCPQLFQGAE